MRAVARGIALGCAILLGYLTLGFCYATVMIATPHVAGPGALPAWLTTFCLWRTARRRTPIPRELAPAHSRIPIVEVAVSLFGAVTAQIVINQYWKYAGDSLFVIGNLIAITCALPQCDVPYARARRRRCSSG